MLNVVEMFSGIGSQAKALENLKESSGITYEILNTVEWDISAFYAYDIIHNGNQDLSKYNDWSKEDLINFLNKHTLSINGKNPVSLKYLRTFNDIALKKIVCAFQRTKNLGNITDLTIDILPKDIDLLTYSFPCQDLSIGGTWHGNNSGIHRTIQNRSGLLWEVERLLLDLNNNNKSLPKFLLMENVSNILSASHRHNFEDWKNILTDLGYINQVYTLDSSNFGSPQKRLRTYMISVFCGKNILKINAIKKYFEDNSLTKNTQPIKPLKDFLRLDYSIPNYLEEANRSTPNLTLSRKKIEENNLFIYDILDEKEVFSKTIKTITTKQDRHPTSGLVRYNHKSFLKMKYRNITPRECFLFMGFEEADFDILSSNNFNIHKNKQFYSREKYERLAGNSIVVDVLNAIFKQIYQIKITFNI
ncbi:hypothetical protein A4G19_07105 [Pasteurellaceae bacterium Macca]|nr:hypothetical protein [Pasteurellaceae bacterium Macca]